MTIAFETQSKLSQPEMFAASKATANNVNPKVNVNSRGFESSPTDIVAIETIRRIAVVVDNFVSPLLLMFLNQQNLAILHLPRRFLRVLKLLKINLLVNVGRSTIATLNI